MEISVSGLANLEPPKPSLDNAAVRAMIEGPNAKKKEKTSFLQRLVRLGSSKELDASDLPLLTNIHTTTTASNAGNLPSHLKPPTAPKGKKASKSFQNPAGVFVPPTGPAHEVGLSPGGPKPPLPPSSSTSLATSSDNNEAQDAKHKPPISCIVISSGPPCEGETSHTVTTAGLDDSYTTGTRSALGRPTGSLSHELAEPDAHYGWSRDSVTSSVSSTSLNDLIEMKIFGSPTAKDKDLVKDKTGGGEHTPTPTATEFSTRSLLQDNPHREDELQIEAEPQPQPQPRTGKELPNQEIALSNHGHSSISGSRRTFQNTCFKPTELVPNMDTAVPVPPMLDISQAEESIDIFSPPGAPSARHSTLLGTETGHSSYGHVMESRKQQQQPLEIKMDPMHRSDVVNSTRRIVDDRDRPGSNRRISVEETSRASSGRYYPSHESTRSSIRHPHSNTHPHAHAHGHQQSHGHQHPHPMPHTQPERVHRMPQPMQGQSSNRSVNDHSQTGSRGPPIVPDHHSHNNLNNINRGPPPNLTPRTQWDNYSYSSSPTILEASAVMNIKAAVPPSTRYSKHAKKERQRYLQRLNESADFSDHRDRLSAFHNTIHTSGEESFSSLGRMTEYVDGIRRTPVRDLVQIYPGVYVPLRSATETEEAIGRDYYDHTKCESCSRDFFCILDAAYAICPKCKCYQALDQENGGRMRHGLGIGFTGKTLCETKAKLRQRHVAHQHPHQR